MSLGWEAWLKHASPHLCYLAERGRSALKGVDLNREPPKLGSVVAPPCCGESVSDPLEIRPSPPV